MVVGTTLNMFECVCTHECVCVCEDTHTNGATSMVEPENVDTALTYRGFATTYMYGSLQLYKGLFAP